MVSTDRTSATAGSSNSTPSDGAPAPSSRLRFWNSSGGASTSTPKPLAASAAAAPRPPPPALKTSSTTHKPPPRSIPRPPITPAVTKSPPGSVMHGKVFAVITDVYAPAALPRIIAQIESAGGTTRMLSGKLDATVPVTDYMLMPMASQGDDSRASRDRVTEQLIRKDPNVTGPWRSVPLVTTEWLSTCQTSDTIIQLPLRKHLWKPFKEKDAVSERDQEYFDMLVGELNAFDFESRSRREFCTYFMKKHPDRSPKIEVMLQKYRSKLEDACPGFRNKQRLHFRGRRAKELDAPVRRTTLGISKARPDKRHARTASDSSLMSVTPPAENDAGADTTIGSLDRSPTPPPVPPRTKPFWRSEPVSGGRTTKSGSAKVGSKLAKSPRASQPAAKPFWKISATASPPPKVVTPRSPPKAAHGPAPAPEDEVAVTQAQAQAQARVPSPPASASIGSVASPTPPPPELEPPRHSRTAPSVTEQASSGSDSSPELPFTDVDTDVTGTRSVIGDADLDRDEASPASPEHDDDDLPTIRVYTSVHQYKYDVARSRACAELLELERQEQEGLAPTRVADRDDMDVDDE